MEKFNYNLTTEKDKPSNVAENNQATNDVVIKSLVEDGIPNVFSPTNFISKIAKEHNISTNEARKCLKSAIKILEDEKKSKAISKPNQRPNEKLNAQSGYFYPSQNLGEQTKPNGEIQSSMDNLNSFGYYNKVMFGLA